MAIPEADQEVREKIHNLEFIDQNIKCKTQEETSGSEPEPEQDQNRNQNRTRFCLLL